MEQIHTRNWVVGALALVVIIFFLWWLPGKEYQNREVGYGTPQGEVLNAPHNTLFVEAENRVGTDVVSVAKSLPDATRFAALLSSSGVGATLTGKGPYTIFVPSDRAFRLVPQGALNLTAAQLKRLVQYHVVSGRAIDVNAIDAGTIQALSKDMLNFSINQNDQSARVNSSLVLQAYKASNGMVYLVNMVLLPPTKPLGQ